MATSYSASTKSTLLHTSLTWTIDNFSYRYPRVGPKAFSDEKNTFHLCLYPNIDGFVNLALFMTTKQSGNIRIKLSLINYHGQSCLLYDQTKILSQYNTKRSDVVGTYIPKFISRADLFEPSNGYLPDDTLTLHCEIVHICEEEEYKFPLKRSLFVASCLALLYFIGMH